MNNSDNKVFDLEHQYQLYLKKVGLKEEFMPQAQRKETRQAFMGACGQMLVMMRDDWSILDNQAAFFALQSMFDQVRIYFTKNMFSEN